MTKFISGQWNAICDRCGFEFKSSELRKDWQGYMVCGKDFETRHPQDLLRVRPEEAVPSFVRQEEFAFLQPASCTLQGSQGIIGIGVVGCLRVKFVTPY